MVKSLSPEMDYLEKHTQMPDLSSISSDQPEDIVINRAEQFKEFLKNGGLTAKDATAQVNRLLERKGLSFKLPEETEKLA